MPDMKTALTLHVEDRQPKGIPPITAIATKARRRRSRRRLGAFGGAAVAAGVAVGAVMQFQPVQQETARDTDHAQVAAPSGQEQQTNQQQPTGEVPVEGTFACERGGPYSPEAVTNTDFAFDGTITRIETGSGDVDYDHRIVTFTVAEWFHGGDGDTIVVTMFRPKVETPPSYDVGSHLLVSGGRGDGIYLAWGCGGTRYYDSVTADAWRRLTR